MTAVTAVSVTANVVLLVLLFYVRQAKRWTDAMAYEESTVRPSFKRYVFRRTQDVTGVSGTGDVCEVAEFSDGHAALHWLGAHPLTTPHPNGIEEIIAIHGHGGKGRLVPIDPS